MDIEELMKRVRRLEVRARRLVKESFSGEYHSSFKGQGLDFDEFREYQHGDEVRFIDWKVSARSQTPYIRTFREERELSVMLAVDISGSMDYGSHHFTKREIAAEVAAVLGFSASANGDKVGLLLFSEETLQYLPPAKGNAHILRIVRDILTAETSGISTSLDSAAQALLQSLKKRSLIFFISDFADMLIQKPLGRLASRHELTTLRIVDPIEERLPKAGKVTLRDPETGVTRIINTNSEKLQNEYHQHRSRLQENFEQSCKRNAIDYTTLWTNQDYLPKLHRLLKRRTQRRLHH